MKIKLFLMATAVAGMLLIPMPETIVTPGIQAAPKCNGLKKNQCHRKKACTWKTNRCSLKSAYRCAGKSKNSCRASRHCHYTGGSCRAK